MLPWNLWGSQVKNRYAISPVGFPEFGARCQSAGITEPLQVSLVIPGLVSLARNPEKPGFPLSWE